MANGLSGGGTGSDFPNLVDRAPVLAPALPPSPRTRPPPTPQDDTEETVRARLGVFKAQTGPVAEWYESELPDVFRRIYITGGARVMTPVFEAALGVGQRARL